MKKTRIQEIVVNRKALQNFTVLDRIEAGIVLFGTEVKSIRENLVDPQRAYASLEKGEVFLHDLYIQPYGPSGHKQHEYKRKRKLLLRRREISKILGRVSMKGYTLVPSRLYWSNALVKVELVLGKGKSFHDKRDILKKKVVQREAERAVVQHTFHHGKIFFW